MTRLLSLLLGFLLVSTLVVAQGNLFKKDISYGRPGTQLNDMSLTYDGQVLLNSTSGQDLVLMKMKLNGDTVWVKSFDSKGGIIGYVSQQFVNKTYITAGVWRDPATNKENGYLIRHDSMGNIMWGRASAAGNASRWFDAAVGPDSSIAAVGYWDAGDDYGLVAKFDASGKLLWAKEGVRGRSVEYERVVFDKVGNIIAVGNASGGGSVVTKFSSSGVVLWNKISSAPTFSCKGVEILPSGNILVCGKAKPVKFNNVFIHKFSPNGNLLLAKEYWTNSFCEPFRIEYTHDDKVMVYGETITKFGGNYNYQNMLMELDTLGKLNWSYNYGDTLEDEINACGLFTPDSAYWIASFEGISYKNVLFKTDKSGNGSCFRYPLVFTDSTHKITYSSGPTIRSYSLSVKSISWGKGSTVYKDTTVCSKNLCKLTTQAKALSNFNGQGVSCHGEKDGVAMVAAQNGAMPVQYSWSANAQNQTTDTAQGLAAGKYYVTVTDANTCSVVDSVVITQPDSLADSLRIITDFNGWNISCFGATNGMVSIKTTGGTQPHSYYWNSDTLPLNSDTAKGLAAGWNTVKIQDANNCLVEDSIFLTEPLWLVTSISSLTKSGCGRKDAFAVVDVSGSVGGYAYQWDVNAGFQTTDTAKGLGAGKYKVVVTDANGCVDSTSVSIVQHENPEVQAGPVKGATCFGDCNGEATSLITKGKPPYTYQWDAAAQNQTSRTASGLCAGTYWVVATDSNNCQDSAQATVGGPAALDTSVTEGVNGLTSNALGVDYQWLDCDNGNAPISGAISQTYMPVTSGSYSVIVSNDSCSDTSACYYVISVGLLSNSKTKPSVEIWPNPTYGRLNLRIDGAENTWHMKVVDAFGKEHLEMKLESSGVHHLSSNHLPSGIYRILLQSDSETLTATFLVK